LVQEVHHLDHVFIAEKILLCFGDVVAAKDLQVKKVDLIVVIKKAQA